MSNNIGLMIFEDYLKDIETKRYYWVLKSKELDYKIYEKEINHKILAYSKLLEVLDGLINEHKEKMNDSKD